MPSNILRASLEEHSDLAAQDVDALASLTWDIRFVRPNDEIVRHGEQPKGSAVVLKGMVGRYQNLSNGRRQFISFHTAGDLPDAQSLFMTEMDHSVCAVGPASIAVVEHRQLLKLFELRPAVGFAVWRETLIDAAIFREAIVNNSARGPLERMSHLFCELYYRQKSAGLAEDASLYFPLTQMQLGDALGMSLVTANRTVQKLRQLKLVDWVETKISILDWPKLAELGQFDPRYLHLKHPLGDLG